MNGHDLHSWRILDELTAGQATTQRRLSRELGIALGLINLLLKRLAKKGWVKVSRVRPGRLMYLVTPEGIAANARLTRAYLAQSLEFYSDARNRIGQRFASLSSELDATCGPARKRVVFWGSDEVAEIGYVCLQGTNLHLVGVIDESKNGSFFGLTIHGPAALCGNKLDGNEFDRLVVMSLADDPKVPAAISNLNVEHDILFWL